MRVTNQLLVSEFLADLNAQFTRLERTQNQITSGKLIRRPSDEPVGASRALQLREMIAQNDQFQRNLDAASAFLSATESSLHSVVDLLQRARELAVQGANGSVSAADLRSIGAEVEELLRQAVQLGNAKHQDFYLFGGSVASSPPYTLVEGATFSVVAPSSTGLLYRAIGVGQQIPINVPGETVLPTALDALAALRNAAVNGTSADVRQTIDQLDDALESVLGGLADVGARLNRVELAQQRYQDVQVTLKQWLSQVEDTDLAEAVTTLSSQQVAYQAALAAGGRILQSSLLDFLR